MGLAFFCLFFWVSGMGCWWFLALESWFPVDVGFVHISWYELVDHLFFSSFFFFLGAGLWQDKTKGPKKSIKRERFLIHFFPSSLHHILLANEFGFLVFAERGSGSFHQG